MSEVKKKFNSFVLDVDGVLTTGQFIYSKDGKEYKIFGPDDNDGLALLKPNLNIHFITGDRKGFDISHKHIVEDKGFPLDLVSTIRRIDWIKERFDLSKVIYMGDGIFDHIVMSQVGYAIAPANADQLAKEHAHYITKRKGGDRAVAEACLHIKNKFFEPFAIDLKLSKLEIAAGEWSV